MTSLSLEQSPLSLEAHFNASCSHQRRKFTEPLTLTLSLTPTLTLALTRTPARTLTRAHTLRPAAQCLAGQGQT